MSGWTIWRRIIVAAAAVWFGLAIVLASGPVHGGFAWVFALLLSGLLIGSAWVTYSVAWRGVFVSRRRAVWLAVPLTPFVALVGACSGWPLELRVRLNEKALRAYAESGPEWVVDHGSPQFVGTFPISGRERRGGAVLLTMENAEFSMSGLAYIPSPVKVDDSLIQLTHLYGPWYRFVIRD